MVDVQRSSDDEHYTGGATPTKPGAPSTTSSTAQRQVDPAIKLANSEMHRRLVRQRLAKPVV